MLEFYYHSQSPPSCIVWMVLKELEIQYKGNVVDMMTEKHKKEEYKKINPHMQLPAIKDGDLLLSESRAIAIYLCQKYEKADKKEKLFPKDVVDIAKFNSLIYRDVDNYLKILNYMRPDEIFAGRAKGPNEDLLSKAKGVLEEYDVLLSKHDYVFGNHLTILDFMYVQTVSAMAITVSDIWDEYPNLKKWKQRLAKLPFFEECFEQPTDANQKFWKEFMEKGAGAFTQ